MRTREVLLVLSGMLVGCGSSAPPPPPAVDAASPTGGSGGGPSIPGTTPPGGAPAGGETPTGGAPALDAATPPPALDAASSGTDGSPVVGGNTSGWYEAEAMTNTLSGSTLTANPPKPRLGKCMPICPPDGVKPGAQCCSAGGEVLWLTQGNGPIPGGLQFNGVTAPADGTYDVTWWYHCGASDNFGDKHCGGQTDPPTTPAGCRPHQIVVNGVELMGTYHFPCFAGSWIEMHAATTALPLKAGANTIKVYPKERDSADMDALQISPVGKGTPPLIKSNNVTGAN
jgi:hypothetical protein